MPFTWVGSSSMCYPIDAPEFTMHRESIDSPSPFSTFYHVTVLFQNSLNSFFFFFYLKILHTISHNEKKTSLVQSSSSPSWSQSASTLQGFNLCSLSFSLSDSCLCSPPPSHLRLTDSSVRVPSKPQPSSVTGL